MLAKCTIGMMGSPFWGVFGDPTIVLRYASPYTARIIKFPQRRSEIAKLRPRLRNCNERFGALRLCELRRFRPWPGRPF